LESNGKKSSKFIIVTGYECSTNERRGKGWLLTESAFFCALKWIANSPANLLTSVVIIVIIGTRRAGVTQLK
jgi:hypothetical protein